MKLGVTSKGGITTTMKKAIKVFDGKVTSIHRIVL
jgi:hypothetical protein